MTGLPLQAIGVHGGEESLAPRKAKFFQSTKRAKWCKRCRTHFCSHVNPKMYVNDPVASALWDIYAENPWTTRKPPKEALAEARRRAR